METELQQICKNIFNEVTKSQIVTHFEHLWWDEDGGHSERPANPERESIVVSYFRPCDQEDEREIERVLGIIKAAIKKSSLDIYQDYYNEDDGEEWIQGVFARGVLATAWAFDLDSAVTIFKTR